MIKSFSDQHREVETDTTCYHCGDDCEEGIVEKDMKMFCCHGCSMVYSILHENGLANYYDLNESAGTSQMSVNKQQFAFLEDEEVVEKLISYTDERRSIIQLYLPQIHCSSCLWLLENLHQLNPNVLQARVNFLKKEVHITFDHQQMSLRALVELLALIGYPPHIILGDLSSDKRPVTDRSLYYKLGLAGFVFGNIMLLSFPEYFGLDMAGTVFQTYLYYIIVALSLPVVLYSGRDYYVSAWHGIKQRHLNIDVPVTLGISVLFFRSIYEITTQTGAGYLDSLAGLIFFLLIGKWFQQATYSRIVFDRDFSSYLPIACSVVHQGVEIQRTLDKLEKGDRVLIRNGELIPADARLVVGEADIDYSFVTGESAQIQKSIGDSLFAGGRQSGGMIEILITKPVSNSYLVQLWNDHAFDKKNKGSVSVLADRVASLFTWSILLIGFITLIYWLPKDTHTAVNAFTAVLIIACPCAVALSIPFTFGNVIRLFARQHIYFKNVQVIENLAKISRIVFDKTGTLTSVSKSELVFDGPPLTTSQKQCIASLVRQSSHPLSRQLYAQFGDQLMMSVRDFKEEQGKGISGVVDGVNIRLGSRKYFPYWAIKRQGTYVEVDGNLLGRFEQRNQYRTGLPLVISQLEKHFKLSLLSGDNDKEQSKLLPLFNESEMHFDQQPQQKLDHIRAAQQLEVVAMIGDGLNDAGALSQADVGIVITENTSNFTPASDIIMEASQFEKLPLLFSFSKLAIRLVYVSYAIALVYNFIGLSYAIQGLLSPVIAAILMPLSSITIVLFGVLSSTYLAWRKGVTSAPLSHQTSTHLG